MSNFSAILERYTKAVNKQFERMARQKRDFLTRDEQAAVKYYAAVSLQIMALENQGG